MGRLADSSLSLSVAVIAPWNSGSAAHGPTMGHGRKAIPCALLKDCSSNQLSLIVRKLSGNIGCSRPLILPLRCPPRHSPPAGKYIINGELMKLVKPDAVVMHPLPRVDEVRRGSLACLYLPSALHCWNNRRLRLACVCPVLCSARTPGASGLFELPLPCAPGVVDCAPGAMHLGRPCCRPPALLVKPLLSLPCRSTLRLTRTLAPPTSARWAAGLAHRV